MNKNPSKSERKCEIQAKSNQIQPNPNQNQGKSKSSQTIIEPKPSRSQNPTEIKLKSKQILRAKPSQPKPQPSPGQACSAAEHGATASRGTRTVCTLQGPVDPQGSHTQSPVKRELFLRIPRNYLDFIGFYYDFTWIVRGNWGPRRS